jgi:hypothetical protein
MSVQNWEVGAWYIHDLYPKRRIQVDMTNGREARGIVYPVSTKFGDSTTAWWPIGLDEWDWSRCTKEDDK